MSTSATIRNRSFKMLFADIWFADMTTTNFYKPVATAYIAAHSIYEVFPEPRPIRMQ